MIDQYRNLDMRYSLRQARAQPICEVGIIHAWNSHMLAQSIKEYLRVDFFEHLGNPDVAQSFHECRIFKGAKARQG